MAEGSAWERLLAEERDDASCSSVRVWGGANVPVPNEMSEFVSDVFATPCTSCREAPSVFLRKVRRYSRFFLLEIYTQKAAAAP